MSNLGMRGFSSESVHIEYPEAHLLFFDDWSIIAGSFTWVNTISGTMYYGQYFSQVTTAADKDALQKKIFLARGNYSFGLYHRRGSTRPLIDFAFDGNRPFLTVDNYGGIANVLTTGEVILQGGGLHTLSMTVNGKNASSSGYAMAINACIIKRVS